MIQWRKSVLPVTVVKKHNVLEVKFLDGLAVAGDEALELWCVHSGIANLEIAQLGEVHWCAAG